MPFQLSKINHDDSDTFYVFICLFISLFIYLFIYSNKSHYGNKISETTRARNLKFGQMTGLFMDLRHCIFGGATPHGLGHMHPKLVTANFGRMGKVASA